MTHPLHKIAFEAGARQALVDAGLVKEAEPTVEDLLPSAKPEDKPQDLSRQPPEDAEKSEVADIVMDALGDSPVDLGALLDKQLLLRGNF